ncbi:MAG TPA: CARDB domain-containing protein [Candidatus Limnocylindrales bacterium]|nr:CARDB domain-containing protein [Candidatus Limnocylindrales bacterium]
MIRRRPRLAGSAAAAMLLAVAVGGLASADSTSLTATVRVADVVVSVRLAISSTSARVGDTVKATATVVNGGTSRIPTVTVSLRADTTGLRIRGADTIVLTSIAPGRPRTAQWTVCAVQPGTFVLLARVSVGGVSVDSPAVLLSVAGQRKKGCS